MVSRGPPSQEPVLAPRVQQAVPLRSGPPPVPSAAHPKGSVSLEQSPDSVLGFPCSRRQLPPRIARLGVGGRGTNLAPPAPSPPLLSHSQLPLAAHFRAQGKQQGGPQHQALLATAAPPGWGQGQAADQHRHRPQEAPSGQPRTPPANRRPPPAGEAPTSCQPANLPPVRTCPVTCAPSPSASEVRSLPGLPRPPTPHVPGSGSGSEEGTLHCWPLPGSCHRPTCGRAPSAPRSSSPSAARTGRIPAAVG